MPPLVGDVCDSMTIDFLLVLILVLTTQVNIILFYFWLNLPFPFFFFFFFLNFTTPPYLPPRDLQTNTLTTLTSFSRYWPILTCMSTYLPTWKTRQGCGVDDNWYKYCNTHEIYICLSPTYLSTKVTMSPTTKIKVLCMHCISIPHIPNFN